MIKYDSETTELTLQGSGHELIAEMGCLISKVCFLLESEENDVSAQFVWEKIEGFMNYFFENKKIVEIAKALLDKTSTTYSVKISKPNASEGK